MEDSLRNKKDNLFSDSRLYSRVFRTMGHVTGRALTKNSQLELKGQKYINYKNRRWGMIVNKTATHYGLQQWPRVHTITEAVKGPEVQNLKLHLFFSWSTYPWIFSSQLFRKDIWLDFLTNVMFLCCFNSTKVCMYFISKKI